MVLLKSDRLIASSKYCNSVVQREVIQSLFVIACQLMHMNNGTGGHFGSEPKCPTVIEIPSLCPVFV